MQQISGRTAFVVDRDAATYKAISRVAKHNDFAVRTFPCHAEFAEWLTGQDQSPRVTAHASCMVMEVQVLSALEERALPNAIRDVPKIYIGVPTFSCELTKLARMGFYSFIEKPFTVGQIGEAVLSAFLHHEKVLHGVLKVTERVGRLSKREYEVGTLVVSGLTNQEIGEKLGISIKTVKAHRANVMGKTDSQTLAELVRCFDEHIRVSGE